MKPVERVSILDYVTYEERREAIRSQVLAIKAPRRVHVGGVLTFLFENTATARYQVQEMVRIERIVREADIQHELATYNELLGGAGELGCTLMIELDDPAERAIKLREWLALPRHVYARLEDGAKVYACFDERQVGDERLSSVHYIKFPVAGRVPLAIGADHPTLTVEARLEPSQRAALAADLAS
ncbi:MAG: DUF3501 family protein [Planctomycetes bacterium]|nr:DUF3501 family protein [Planctomycetota bacterium]